MLDIPFIKARFLSKQKLNGYTLLHAVSPIHVNLKWISIFYIFVHLPHTAVNVHKTLKHIQQGKS